MMVNVSQRDVVSTQRLRGLGLAVLASALVACGSAESSADGTDSAVAEDRQPAGETDHLDSASAMIEASLNSDAAGLGSEAASAIGDAGAAEARDAMSGDMLNDVEVSSRADGGPLSLDPTADVRSLADADLARFCDWVNETLGGYGLVTNCGGGNTVANDDDAAACITKGFHPRCAVTVADYQECVLAQAPSHGCELPFSSCHALVCF